MFSYVCVNGLSYQANTKLYQIMKDSRNLIGGLIAGTAMGIAIGMLLAPASGGETRKRITDGSVKLKDDVMSSVDESIESLKNQFNKRADMLAKGGKDLANHAGDRAKL
jgi:gas vesicle protein